MLLRTCDCQHFVYSLGMDTPHPLVEARARLGKISQEELGRRLGVEGMTVSRWERGESVPRRRIWPKLEEITGTPIAEILSHAKPAEATQ